MKKVLKILLVSLVCVALTLFAILGIDYYRSNYVKTRATPTIRKTYYSKEDYLNEYNDKLYKAYEGYPLALKEDCAIKDYSIEYDVIIPIRKSCNPVGSSRQELYVYDETLGYTINTENDYQYSFKVAFVGYYFCVKSLDGFTRSYMRGEDEDYISYSISFAPNESQDFGYYALFYSSLDLPDDYCQKFLDDNIIVLNEE